MKKYLILGVEHSEDLGNPPNLLFIADKRDEAEKWIEAYIQKSLMSFPTMSVYDDGMGFYSDDGYSFIANIVEVVF